MSNFEKAKNSHEELMQERYKHRDKTADEMFKELGFVKKETTKIIIYSDQRFRLNIMFEKDYKSVMCSFRRFEPDIIVAINTKLNELGWLDE